MLNLFNKKYLSYLLLIFPPALVSGPFLPDLILTTSSIFFIIFLIINKNVNFLNTDFTKFFFIFYVFIILSSIFSDEVLFKGFVTAINGEEIDIDAWLKELEEDLIEQD